MALRQSLACFDLFAVLDCNRNEASIHRRADRGIALPRASVGLGKWIDELDKRLPPAGESVHAPFCLVEHDIVVVAQSIGVRSRFLVSSAIR